MSQKFVTYDKWALVEVMAWCQTGDKPLPEPKMINFINEEMHPQTLMSKVSVDGLAMTKDIFTHSDDTVPFHWKMPHDIEAQWWPSAILIWVSIWKVIWLSTK